MWTVSRVLTHCSSGRLGHGSGCDVALLIDASLQRGASLPYDVGEMPLEAEAADVCPICFEQGCVGVDPGAGRRQQFIEDCPVCCHPIEFKIALDPSGDATVLDAASAS